MAEQNALDLELFEAFVEAIKARIPLLTELEEKNLQLQKKDPKTNLLQPFIQWRKKFVLFAKKSLRLNYPSVLLVENLDILFVPLVTAMKIILKMTRKVFSGVPESVLTQLLIWFFPNLMFLLNYVIVT